MARLSEVLERLPEEIRLPLFHAFEILREELRDTVRRSDFEELKGVVRELAEAQKRTEQRVEELAQAQRELAEAQKRTEQRVEELAEAQRQLAEAQKRTEEEVRELARIVADIQVTQKHIQQELGGLGHTVGYRLEDEAMKALPNLLREKGIEVRGRLWRGYLDIGEKMPVEVNIFGEGKWNGEDVVILGFAKSQVKRKDVADFLDLSERVSKAIPKRQVRVVITYQTIPDVIEYIKEQGLILYFSWEL